MTDRLKGKTAFITAAGQGIGRATAEAFLSLIHISEPTRPY